jgi:hypothetical protein
VTLYSIVAKHIDRGGRHRLYHIKIITRLPTTKFELVTIIEDASQIARYRYELKEFILQFWQRPEVRHFKKTWLMEFDILFLSYEEHPEIKAARFNVSDRLMFFLKQDYLYGGVLTIEALAQAEPQLSEPPIALTSSGPAQYISPYSGLNGSSRKKGEGAKLQVEMKRYSGGHGPSTPSERAYQGMWRKPLWKTWRRNPLHGPSGEDDF